MFTWASEVANPPANKTEMIELFMVLRSFDWIRLVFWNDLSTGLSLPQLSLASKTRVVSLRSVGFGACL